MQKLEMQRFILKYMIDYPYDEDIIKRQTRALFTAWCIMFDILPDTLECDRMFDKMYALTDSVEKEEFENYMLEDLV